MIYNKYISDNIKCSRRISLFLFARYHRMLGALYSCLEVDHPNSMPYTKDRKRTLRKVTKYIIELHSYYGLPPYKINKDKINVYKL